MYYKKQSDKVSYGKIFASYTFLQKNYMIMCYIIVEAETYNKVGVFLQGYTGVGAESIRYI